MSEHASHVYSTYPASGEGAGLGEYEAPLVIASSIGEVTLGSFDRQYPDVIGQYSWTKPSVAPGSHPSTDTDILP